MTEQKMREQVEAILANGKSYSRGSKMYQLATALEQVLAERDRLNGVIDLGLQEHDRMERIIKMYDDAWPHIQARVARLEAALRAMLHWQIDIDDLMPDGLHDECMAALAEEAKP